MKHAANRIVMSPTDLSNHLGCKHLTQLNRAVAEGKLAKPDFANPSLAALAERGMEHERAYVQYLKDTGKTVAVSDEHSTVEQTVKMMMQGADVIVQAALSDGNWDGRADLLLKVDKPSHLGGWSYEAGDTKLSVETKAGTILQLCVYSELLSTIQGTLPEYMHVIKPGQPFDIEKFRFDDFKAYFGRVKQSLETAVLDANPATYPEPVDQCNVCRWWKECDDERRRDDHLSLVAGMRKTHISEFNRQQIFKLAELAQRDKPLSNAPDRGHIDSYQRVYEQAKIQHKGRGLEKPIYELLTPLVERKGFNRLPEPNEGDVYFDFEGDPYYRDGGIEYLFGIVYKEDGKDVYKAYWALDRELERKAFDEFMQFIIVRWELYPQMHIYHYSHYEPTAIKRLMQRYAMHESAVDKILRGERLVDLYSIAKEILRASVETYSIKNLEKLADFVRKCDLRDAGTARRGLEYILEFKTAVVIPESTLQIVADYNEDDCKATQVFHLWLEAIRADEVIKGAVLSRPVLSDGVAKKERTQHEERLKKMQEELASYVPADATLRTEEQNAYWLLAHLVHYYDREAKNEWWEFFRVHKSDVDELYEEKSAIVGLIFEKLIPKFGRQKLDRYRYSFPPQETTLEAGIEVHEVNGEKVGEIDSISLEDRHVVINQSTNVRGYAVHGFKFINPKVLEDSLLAVIDSFKSTGVEANTQFKAARDLLLRRMPNLSLTPDGPLIRDMQELAQQATELVLAMQESVLAIQGPPGTGKTHIGAQLILALIKSGKKIGVTAVSHKVIRNLLDKVHEFAEAETKPIKLSLVHKTSDSENPPSWIEEVNDNTAAIGRVQAGTVLGATTFFWAHDRALGKVDYLFVDEAGQMSLANVLAASRATRNLILLGDPQQLEQPQKGSHPEGADVAALTHLMDGKQTIPEGKGIFLGSTYRLHEKITKFTSEVFYESRLTSQPELKQIGIQGGPYAGAGLFFQPVVHQGRQTICPEEVSKVKEIAERFINDGTEWINRKGELNKITIQDILIVAPYNSQVKALMDSLPGYRIGTVDMFQGQEAAIVIYSVTCSSSEDAPRGMSFMYSPNRLNVATSRALCTCILLGTERIFETDCRTIEQMRWVNAFCRYRSLATIIE